MVDLADDTFLVADPAAVAARLADPAGWPHWWRGLRLHVTADRGPAGLQATVAGAWVGRLEVWLEPCRDGVVVHHYVWLDRWSGRPHHPQRWREAYRRRWKRRVWALADELDADRPPGTPRPGPVKPVGLPTDAGGRDRSRGPR